MELAQKIRNSFVWKLSTTLLLILFILAAVQVTYFAELSRKNRDALDQISHASLAETLAEKLSSPLQQGASREQLLHHIPKDLLDDSRIDIYIVTESGKVVSHLSSRPADKLFSIDTQRIERFLNRTRAFPIYGSDPRFSSILNVFSAASIRYHEEKAYLYILLGEEFPKADQRKIRHDLARSNIAFQLMVSFLISGAIGILIFRQVVRPLNATASAVEKFAAGNMDIRVDVSSDDEIGRVARIFNSMADTIQNNIEKMDKNDRLRRELVSNVAHDLRSPLTSMYGYAETLAEHNDKLSEEKRIKIERTLFKNIQTLTKLVDDLFDLSKLEAEDRVPNLRAVSLEDLFCDLQLKYEGIAEERGLAFSAVSEPKLPVVHIDISMFERALSNLIDNSFRNTPEGGVVVLEAKSNQTSSIISVKDTGSGIAPEEIPHLFERFFSRTHSETEDNQGNGLGLAIVKKVIDVHHFEINVTSALGKGTIVSILIPSSETLAARSKE